MFGWDFEVDAWSRFWRWNLIKICVWTCNINLKKLLLSAELNSRVRCAFGNVFAFINFSTRSKRSSTRQNEASQNLPTRKLTYISETISNLWDVTFAFQMHASSVDPFWTFSYRQGGWILIWYLNMNLENTVNINKNIFYQEEVTKFETCLRQHNVWFWLILPLGHKKDFEMKMILNVT